MNQNLYPHLFQPLTIRGVTLKNRLEYAPTSCSEVQCGRYCLDRICRILWLGRQKPVQVPRENGR